MKAAVLHTLGKPPRFEEFPEPTAGEGEVIAHVRAAALKPIDGESAGPIVSLTAAVLRSTGLTILGTAGIPPRDILDNAYQEFMARAARGELRIEIDRVPLAAIEEAWQRQHQRRLVIIP